jgi:glutathione S-transferase
MHLSRDAFSRARRSAMLRAMEPLTLYVDRFWISPYALSSYVALKEKGLPFDVQEVGLDRRDHHEPAYQQASITGRVPSLRHGDFWLSESSAIAEYLAETFPFPKHPRIFPEDLRQRGRCRQIMAWVRSDLMPIREERPTTTLFYERANTPLSPEGERAAERLLRAAALLIPDGRTTLFDTWCIADADFGLMLQRLNLNGHPLPPKVKAYAEAQWQRPSVRSFIERERAAYVPY